jgi:hypothetical protein
MNCEAAFCLKPITEGNLMVLDLKGVNPMTGQVKPIKMLVSVCDYCIKKFKAEKKIIGSIKIIE